MSHKDKVIKRLDQIIALLSPKPVKAGYTRVYIEPLPADSAYPEALSKTVAERLRRMGSK